VRALHARGFRHRNLDLRNIVARPQQSGGAEEFDLAVLDAPRHRLVPPGRSHDRLARRDWERLAASCAEVGFHLPLDGDLRDPVRDVLRTG
jgi:hypothetical protein